MCSGCAGSNSRRVCFSNVYRNTKSLKRCWYRKRRDQDIPLIELKWNRVPYRAALLAGRARLLLARLGRVRVLLWYWNQPKQEWHHYCRICTHIMMQWLWPHDEVNQEGTLTSFACLSGKSSRQLALYLLEKKRVKIHQESEIHW